VYLEENPILVISLSFEVFSSHEFALLCFVCPQNDTALICASYKGHVEVVKLLVALPGIDYNHEDNEVWCQNIPLLCMPQKVYTWPLILRHFCNHRITLHLSLQVIKVMLKW
jgi:hypothetical protein